MDPTPLCKQCNETEEDVYPTQSTVYIPPDEEEEEETLSKLIIHRNLGHPSNKLLQQILRDTHAPQSVITAAGQLKCSLCQRFTQIEPARPVAVTHAKRFNETLCIDVAYHNLPEGRHALVIHFVDEASRFHIEDIIRGGTFASTDKDARSVLGNVSQRDLLNRYHNSWVRYFGHPQRIHVDADGVFS